MAVRLSRVTVAWCQIVLVLFDDFIIPQATYDLTESSQRSGRKDLSLVESIQKLFGRSLDNVVVENAVLALVNAIIDAAIEMLQKMQKLGEN